jgi:CRISPR-associated protein Csc2
MSVLETYAQRFLPTYENFPQGHYASLLLVRQIESEAIFRTEGTGEPLNKEFVHAGLNGDEVFQRVVISKRKQTAVERRTGRELLRQFELLKPNKDGEECALNRNNPCEQCMDCMIYGYAAGGRGAQRSRVITDDAFSLHNARTVIDTRQFNALFDNSTMRDPETDKASASIGTDEYVKPESIFLDIETLRDLTIQEFIYVLGNVLRSSRYGAISSRLGKVCNHVAGVILSDCEVFSNLELTQAVYDKLRPKNGNGKSIENGEPDFPLRARTVISTVREQADKLCKQIPGRLTILSEDDVRSLIRDITAIYQDEGQLRENLNAASAMYG